MDYGHDKEFLMPRGERTPAILKPGPQTGKGNNIWKFLVNVTVVVPVIVEVVKAGKRAFEAIRDLLGG